MTVQRCEGRPRGGGGGTTGASLGSRCSVEWAVILKLNEATIRGWCRVGIPGAGVARLKARTVDDGRMEIAHEDLAALLRCLVRHDHRLLALMDPRAVRRVMGTQP